MKKLLFYIEPHPFRNSFTQMWNQEIKKLIPALVDNIPEDYEVRIFSNEPTITAIMHEIAAVAPICLRPTYEESDRIFSYLRQWDEEEIQRRNDLILGRGEVTEFYYGILKRIHSEVFDFDYILNWSDNGAVKKFAEDRNLICLFGELGPTRAPFSPTIYFDHEGTNGFASICKAEVEDLLPLQVVSKRIWSASGKHTSVYDIPLTLPVSETDDELFLFPDRKYIFVALQLADDLNTVLCSKYEKPLEFLRQIIDDFKDSGYDIVVKGHPGAKIRAYNLKAQEEARRLTESYEHVYFLDSSVGALETISWYIHAEATISINSSLSFEAVLSSKKAFVAGKAIYNLSGLMDYVPGDVNLTEKSARSLDKAVSFLMGHYFHPTDCVFNTKLVYDLFDFYREMKDRGILGKREFWQAYAQRFTEGFKMLLPVEFTDEEVVEITNMSIISILMNQAYKIKSLDTEEQNSVLNFTDKSGRKYKKSIPIKRIFDYSLDKIELRENKVYVDGWAFERGKKIPPLIVLVFFEDEYVSRHRVINKRVDVQQIHNLSNSMDFGFKFECLKKGDISEYSFLLISENGTGQLVRKR